jgi:prepilin-type processing-associated H-X9-DG protein
MMDYAALAPAPSRSQMGNAAFDGLLQVASYNSSGTTYTTNLGCRNAYGFWGIKTYGNDWDPAPASILAGQYTGFWGVIIRSSYLVDAGAVLPPLGYGQLVSFRKIKDGTSKTAVITEKRLRTDTLASTGIPDDDRGWSDGWDIDTLRSSICAPKPDGRSIPNLPLNFQRADHLTAGAAHVAGLNVWFADGSVRTINYDIDIENWNRMAHRADQEPITYLQ